MEVEFDDLDDLNLTKVYGPDGPTKFADFLTKSLFLLPMEQRNEVIKNTLLPGNFKFLEPPKCEEFVEKFLDSTAKVKDKSSMKVQESLLKAIVPLSKTMMALKDKFPKGDPFLAEHYSNLTQSLVLIGTSNLLINRKHRLDMHKYLGDNFDDPCKKFESFPTTLFGPDFSKRVDEQEKMEKAARKATKNKKDRGFNPFRRLRYDNRSAPYPNHSQNSYYNNGRQNSYRGMMVFPIDFPESDDSLLFDRKRTIQRQLPTRRPLQQQQKEIIEIVSKNVDTLTINKPNEDKIVSSAQTEYHFSSEELAKMNAAILDLLDQGVIHNVIEQQDQFLSPVFPSNSEDIKKITPRQQSHSSNNRPVVDNSNMVHHPTINDSSNTSSFFCQTSVSRTQTRRVPQIKQGNASDWLEDLKRDRIAEGFSEDAANLFAANWRASTIKTYTPGINKWKKVFQERPALPKYTHTWDVGIALRELQTWWPHSTLKWPKLQLKLLMLIALASAQRVSTPQSLSLDDLHLTDKEAIWIPSQLSKQTRPGHHVTIKLASFEQDRSICPVTALTGEKTSKPSLLVASPGYSIAALCFSAAVVLMGPLWSSSGPTQLDQQQKKPFQHKIF
uniref:Uncharacterized protein n=1 Tax=Strigamia maritima TaxID=126957 RepID=T1II29_STRMM